MRYHRNGEPLWVSDEGKPSDGDIPVCDCGSERVFEFQVDGFEIFIMFYDGVFQMVLFLSFPKSLSMDLFVVAVVTICSVEKEKNDNKNNVIFF